MVQVPARSAVSKAEAGGRQTTGKRFVRGQDPKLTLRITGEIFPAGPGKLWSRKKNFDFVLKF
jgi:hypothetical protein